MQQTLSIFLEQRYIGRLLDDITLLLRTHQNIDVAHVNASWSHVRCVCLRTDTGVENSMSGRICLSLVLQVRGM